MPVPAGEIGAHLDVDERRLRRAGRGPVAAGRPRSPARATRPAGGAVERVDDHGVGSIEPVGPANSAGAGSHATTVSSTSGEPSATYGGFETITSKRTSAGSASSPRAATRCRTLAAGPAEAGEVGAGRPSSASARAIGDPDCGARRSGSSSASASPIAPDPVPRSATCRDRAGAYPASSIAIRRRVRSPGGGSARVGRREDRGGGTPNARARTGAARRRRRASTIASRWATAVRSVGSSSSRAELVAGSPRWRSRRSSGRASRSSSSAVVSARNSRHVDR